MSFLDSVNQALKKSLMRLLEKTLRREPLDPNKVPWDQVRKILVVRQHDQLGDFLLSTPVLGALRNRFPKAHIGLVVRGYFAEAAVNHPDVDEILVWQPLPGWTPRNFGVFWKALRSGWDLAVVLNTVSHSLTSDLLAHFSKAPYILGSQHNLFPGCRDNFFYNLLAPHDYFEKSQTDTNLDIVRRIGADTDEKSEVLRLTEEEKSAARREMENLGWKGGLPLVGLHLGAGHIENRWPVEKFAALSSRLGEKGIQVVVFWGPKEAALKDVFIRSVAVPPILVEPGRLRALAGLFTCCSCLVVHDTGVMHLGAAVGTPLVTLFGPSNPVLWKPLGEKFHTVKSPDNSMEKIGVDEVYREILQLV